MKTKFLNIVIAEIVQKKLKSYIFTAVLFVKWKTKTSVQESVINWSKAIELVKNHELKLKYITK